MKNTLLIGVILMSKFVSGQQYQFLGIPQDKQMHFAASTVINATIQIPAYDYFYKHGNDKKTARQKAQLLGFGITFGLGIIKEVIDYRIAVTNQTMNANHITDMEGDLLADLLGNVTATIIFSF